MSKISTADGIMLYYLWVKCLQMWSWKGLYKSKLQESVQLQTVLAMYDQETARNSGKPNYWHLKTAVQLHIDQMMRTLNFRVRCCGKRISHQASKRKESLRSEARGRVFSVEGTWTMFQRRLMQLQWWPKSPWKQSRWPETKRTIVFSCIQFEGKDWRRGTTTLKVIRQQRGKLAWKKERNSRPIQNMKIPSCQFWHPQVCQRKDVYMATNDISDMLRQKEKAKQKIN